MNCFLFAGIRSIFGRKTLYRMRSHLALNLKNHKGIGMMLSGYPRLLVRAYTLPTLLMLLAVMLATYPASAAGPNWDPLQDLPKFKYNYLNTEILPKIGGNSGASVQSIPISVPPGRAGLFPELALFYHSSRKNGWLGMGWSLEVGAIQRATRRGLDYDGFRFLADGEELVAVSAEGEGQYYRAKIEGAFSQYYYVSADQGWVVTTRDGIKYYYGSSLSSQQDNDNGIFKWCLDRVVDANGNEIVYTYVKDQGAIYLSRIEYSGGLNVVQLTTEIRPDVYTMNDTHAPVTTGIRLSKIETFGNGALAHTYTFTYDQGAVTERSRLVRIKDNHLPPVDLFYQEGGLIDIETEPVRTSTTDMTNEDRRKYFADVNGDNRMDLIKRDVGGDCGILLANGDGSFGPLIENDLASIPVEKLYFLFPDVDGDGKSDVVKHSDSHVHVYLSNGDGTLSGPFKTRLEHGLPINGSISFADVSGNGRLDLCQRNTNYVHVYLSNGDGTFGTQRTYDGTFGLPVTTEAHGLSDEYIARNFTDVNGDGLADFLWNNSISYRLMLGNADGTFGPDLHQGDLGDTTWSWPEIYPIDLNGDGLNDLLRWNYHSDLKVNLSMGDGTFGPELVTDTRDIGTENRLIYFVDMNGDGLLDFVKRNHNVNIFAIHFSKGDGTFEADGIQFEIPAMPNEDSWGNLVDVTGDGVAEIVMHDLYGNFDAYSMKNVDADLMIGAGVAVDNSDSNQYINLTEIEYGPSSAYNNHVLPFVLPTVSRITKTIATNKEDSSEPIVSTYNYSYEGGHYDAEYKEFRGFESVVETRPDGASTTSVYHQDEFFKNRIAQTILKASDGTVLQETNATWEKWSTDDFWGFVRLASQRTDFFFNPTVFSQEAYTYDNTHGGILTKTVSGSEAESITTTNTYQNYGDWIWRTTRQSVSGSASGKVRESISAYENGTGSLLSEEQWLATGTNPRVTYTYDSYGNVRTMTNAMGYVTTADYDSVMNAFPVRVTSPDTNGINHVVQFLDYDYRWGKPGRSIDENGNATLYTFDNLGRLVQKDLPDGGQFKRDFFDAEMPRKVVTSIKEDAGGSTVDLIDHYDGLGRKVISYSLGAPDSVNDPNTLRWIRTETYFDELGRQYLAQGPFYDGSTDPKPESRTFFDELDRPIRIEQPDPDYGIITSTISYSGFDVRSTDPDGASKTEVKDYLGRVIEVIEHTDSSDQVTTYEYNAAGNLLTVTNHIGNTTIISYDTLGRKIAMDDPDMGHWVYAYDANGNLISQTDAKDQTVTFDYDELDRMVSKQYITDDEPVSYQYDNTGISNGIGRLYETTKGEVRAVITGYDTMGRVLGETKHIPGMDPATTQYEYDLAGKLKTVDYPNFMEITYAYFPKTGLVRTIYTPFMGSAGVLGTFADHRPSGKIGTIKRKYTDADDYLITDTYDYHPQSDRLEKITTQVAGHPDPLRESEYDYTPAGDIKEIRDLVKNRTYTYAYDKLHRLVEEIATGSFPSKPDTTFDYFYDDADKPHAVRQIDVNGFPATAYDYDDNGNMTDGPDLTDPGNEALRNLAWDADNMPLSVIHNRYGSTFFTYDGNGKRVKKSGPAGTTYYVNQYYEIINGEEVCYIWAGNQRIAKYSSSGMQFFHKDHLGSSSLITDDEGNVLESIDYYPFGGQRDYSGSVVSSYKFTDQELDTESGLYNYDARLYDPVIGLFITADNIVPGKGFDPQLLNRFVYVRNNPLKYVDPSGHHLGGINGPQDYYDFDDHGGGRVTWGSDKATYERNYSLRNTSYNRETQKYYFNDPNIGQRRVTPFEDNIPQFDWHKDRNIFNIIPEEMPEKVKVEIWRYRGYEYQDQYGNSWIPDNPITSGIYHGWENTTFRGTGLYQGSQVTYGPDGKIIDSGPYMGTFDYGSPPSREHSALDVKPHDPVNNPYTPNLSTIY